MATKKTEKTAEKTTAKKSATTKKAAEEKEESTPKKAAVKSVAAKKTTTAAAKKTTAKKAQTKKKSEKEIEEEIEEIKEEAKKDEYIPDEVDIVRELPDRYKETKLVLMMRDPEWCFFYWDISDNDIAYHSLKDKRISVRIFHVFGYDVHMFHPFYR